MPAPVILVALLTLLAAVLRLIPLFGDPLHQDEALYGYWGRLVSTGRDIRLASVPVDKPPLVPYLIAAAQTLLGPSQFALRASGFVASLFAVPLTYVLARELYRDGIVALVAAAVMGVSPYAVLFGATAFTDPVLVAFWLAACWWALRGRWGWSGLFLGLAFASKQSALALVPLVLVFGLVHLQRHRAEVSSGVVRKGTRTAGRWGGAVAGFLLGFGAVFGTTLVWDRVRVADGAAAGFWQQGVDSYGGLRAVFASELAPRLQGWAGLGGYLLGWPAVSLVFCAGLVLLLWADLTRQRKTWAALADLLLVAFGCYYSLFHWLLAFPVWDRYLLPLLPVAALLLGRMAALFSRRWRQMRASRSSLGRSAPVLLSALLFITLAASGISAAGGQIPLGGDHGAYDGLEEIVAFLRELPPGTVLYDRWLSWHYDYYLFDAYLYRAGFPSATWLAADAAAFFDGRSRYLVLPSWESPTRIVRALAAQGLAASPIFQTHRRDGTTSFVVYAITAQEKRAEQEP